ncbi:MAG: hypothetical protein NTV00_14265 [Methylococcales bacterium]|nr:hypothetical protein [Methylococcales bacterium]
MARPPLKSVEKPIEKTSGEKEVDADEDFDSPEYVSLSDDAEKELKKMVARRKIEIYWEKKRLKDQFDDFEDSEFDF